MKPIPGTQEYVECDTLLLSVGLIPENELSKDIGIELDAVTGGPDVDQARQTQCEGVFACGNVLQVHDLVDYVTEESMIAGRSAADYILGKSSKDREFIKTITGEGVRYIVPQRINIKSAQDIKLYFRVGAVYTNARVIVTIDDKEVYNKRKVKLTPGEMENVKITEDMMKEMNKDSKLEIRIMI